jgi:N,N'-diacetyllegionaminate synthase
MKELKNYGFNTSKMFYTIAEIGINHGGELDVAKSLIDSAVRAGADSVKFQTYLTEKRAPKDSPIFDILKNCELPFSSFEILNDHAKEQNIDFFSTAFDEESVECLEDIGVDSYKVASFDVVNHRLLRRIAKTGKTIIMSVGMADLKEIKEAYNIISEKTSHIVLLHCVSAYPTNKEDANLSIIMDLMEEFDCLIGQSDHTNDIKVPLYAASMGAQILEKHYKISNDMDCIDSPVSITENQMTKFVNELKVLEEIIGESFIGMLEAEKGSQQFRRPSK